MAAMQVFSINLFLNKSIKGVQKENKCLPCSLVKVNHLNGLEIGKRAQMQFFQKQKSHGRVARQHLMMYRKLSSLNMSAIP